MPKNTPERSQEQGSVTVIALIILVVLTLIGLSASRTADIEIKIAANQIPFKRGFYVAEGGLHREAAEIGRGNYPVTNISTAVVLGTDTNPDPSGDHILPDADGDGNPETYDFEVSYVGFYPPPTGYSVIHFSRYDYGVWAQAEGKLTDIKNSSRYYKIGPRAE